MPASRSSPRPATADRGAARNGRRVRPRSWALAGLPCMSAARPARTAMRRAGRGAAAGSAFTSRSRRFRRTCGSPPAARSPMSRSTPIRRQVTPSTIPASMTAPAGGADWGAPAPCAAMGGPCRHRRPGPHPQGPPVARRRSRNAPSALSRLPHRVGSGDPREQRLLAGPTRHYFRLQLGLLLGWPGVRRRHRARHAAGRVGRDAAGAGWRALHSGRRVERDAEDAGRRPLNPFRTASRR